MVSFLEEQALPVILGVDAETAAARNAGLHQRLAETGCSVFYDPTVAPGVSGRFRYVARPVPLRGRLCPSEACGHGGPFRRRNRLGVSRGVVGEPFAIRLGPQRRVLRRDLDPHAETSKRGAASIPFFSGLQERAPLGEETSTKDAVTAVRAVLVRMPNRKRFRGQPEQPWSGSLRAQFYSSVVNKEGLPAFLKKGPQAQACGVVGVQPLLEQRGGWRA